MISWVVDLLDTAGPVQIAARLEQADIPGTLRSGPCAARGHLAAAAAGTPQAFGAAKAARQILAAAWVTC